MTTTLQPESFPAAAPDILQYYVHAFHDRQCRCVLTFDRALEAERLQRAVALSLDAAPVLGCRYVQGPWRSRWQRCSSAEARSFQLVRTPEPQPAIRDFLAEPMDPLEGPLAAVRLVRSDQDTLCIKLHHMAADATALLDYAQLLGGVYRQLLIDPDYRPAPASAVDRGQGQVLRAAGLRAVATGCLHFSYPISAWGFPGDRSDLSGRAFVVRPLGAEQLAALKAYSQAERVRFSDVLVTAFYRALIAIVAPAPGTRIPVTLTLDLRSYLPGGRVSTICDLSGVFLPVLRHQPGLDFDETLALVSRATARAKREQPWLGGALLLELLARLPTALQKRYAHRMVARELASGTAVPFLSNLGIIDPTMFGFGDAVVTDLAMFGPVAFPPDFLVTIYTFRGRLAVTCSFCDTAVEPRLVDEFLDRFLGELPA